MIWWNRRIRMIWRLSDSIFAQFYTWVTVNVGYFRWLDRINRFLHRKAYFSGRA
jgi:hypothetical protein